MALKFSVSLSAFADKSSGEVGAAMPAGSTLYMACGGKPGTGGVGHLYVEAANCCIGKHGAPGVGEFGARWW
ncbi:hypothetical protein ACFXTN_007707 [Malus domestica]